MERGELILSKFTSLWCLIELLYNCNLKAADKVFYTDMKSFLERRANHETLHL
jgi:hypothetical protein